MRIFLKAALIQLGLIFSKHIKFLLDVYNNDVNHEITAYHDIVNEVILNVSRIGVYIKKHPEKSIFQLEDELKTLFGYDGINANFIDLYRKECNYSKEYCVPKLAKLTLAYTVITDRLQKENTTFTERIVNFVIQAGVNKFKNIDKI